MTKKKDENLVDAGWVALLDEHSLTSEDGTVVCDIDEERLQAIAENMNKKIKETGDWTPCVIGHTKDGQDEKDGPELVGYSVKYAVKPFMRTGKKALCGLLKFFKDKKDTVLKFPRRSVELWLNKWEIDPISLLGATTPARDLGLLRFHRPSKSLHYSRSIFTEDKIMPDDNNMVAQFVAALQQLPEFQFLHQFMEQMQGQKDQDTDLPPDQDQDQGQEPEPSPQAQPDPDNPQQYAAASAPSGSNTFVAGGDGHQPRRAPGKAVDKTWGIAKPPTTGLDRVKMERDQLQGQVLRMTRENVNTVKALNDIKVQLQRERREKDLIQLEANEGIIFDRATELDDVTDMAEDKYQKHIQKMRVRYQRCQLGGLGKITENSTSVPPGTKMSHTLADVQAIADYALKHNMSYEDAMAATTGEHVS